MAPRTQVSKVTVLAVDETLPAVAQAASVALRVLQKTKADTWDELAERVAEQDEATLKALRSLHLDDAQRNLLAEHPAAVALVAYSTPRRTIAVCSTCHEPVVVTKTVPSSCDMTIGCDGTYTKVQPAKAETIPADDIEPAHANTEERPDTEAPEHDEPPAPDSHGADSADGQQGASEPAEADDDDEEEFEFA